MGVLLSRVGSAELCGLIYMLPLAPLKRISGLNSIPGRRKVFVFGNGFMCVCMCDGACAW